MNDFILKELITQDIEQELNKIGFDSSYCKKACDKYRYKTIKIFDLTLPQANILKQTALSFGADCGVHHDVLVNKIEKTDAILGGSYSQIRKICEKLKLQPFSMKILAEKIERLLVDNKRKTQIVGILNLTPDSFSNDGILNQKTAIETLHKLVTDGANIIDIGAESTRPNSTPVPADEQIKRLGLIINEVSNLNIPLSIDTKDSKVARYALDNGFKIVNDVSGFDLDKNMIETISKYNAGIVIQHSAGNAENIIEYKDIVEDVYKSLLKKVELAQSKGITNIIIDPGIGFSKSREQNFEILNRINEFYSINCPIMVGISRKSFLCQGINNNEIKDSLSLALAYPLIKSNVDFLRVHNVKLHKQLLNSVI